MHYTWRENNMDLVKDLDDDKLHQIIETKPNKIQLKVLKNIINLGDLLGHLSLNEAFIICGRYTMDKKISYDEIGKNMLCSTKNISRQRTKQLDTKALNILRDKTSNYEQYHGILENIRDIYPNLYNKITESNNVCLK